MRLYAAVRGEGKVLAGWNEQTKLSLLNPDVYAYPSVRCSYGPGLRACCGRVPHASGRDVPQYYYCVRLLGMPRTQVSLMNLLRNGLDMRTVLEAYFVKQNDGHMLYYMMATCKLPVRNAYWLYTRKFTHSLSEMIML